MSFRNFSDRSGARWQVKPRSKGEWNMEPLPGNPAARRIASPPLYATDPFELSEQELQRILEDAREAPYAVTKPPWEEDDPPQRDPSSLFKE